MITLQERVHGVTPPSDWAKKKLHHVLRVRTGNKNVGMLEENLLSLSYGKIIPKSIDTTEGLLPESFETYQIVDPGNIVMRLTDLQNDKRSWREGLVRERGIVTSAYDALYVGKGDEPRFWSFALLALDLAKYYYSLGGGVRQSIKFSDFPNDWLAVPNIDTQKVIADFLDRETARIDRLVAKNELIAHLINAKWEAIIHDARSEPESEWARFNTTVERVYRPISESSDASYVPLGLYNRGRGFFKKIETDEEDLGDSKFFWVQEGDIVFSGQFAWEGAIGHVSEEENGCVVSHRYPVYRAKEGVEGAYLYAFFRTAHGAFLMDNCSRGAAGRNRPLNTWSLERESVLIPSEATQKEIARLVVLEQKVRRLVAQYVRKASELRSALVIAAVTGQLDIRRKLTPIAIQPDRSKFRLVVGAEIIDRHRGRLKFGRTKWQKELYLAEAHAGISELRGNYSREAAGPLDRTLIEETEAALEAEGYYRACQLDGAGTPVTYAPLSNAGQHAAELQALLGSRAEGLRNLINLLRDLDTEAVEAVTTLYAVWNDALIDGEDRDDAAIIKGVLTEWHTEKGEKFKAGDLARWLDWMKRHGLTPRGQGPRTVPTMTPDMFP